MTKRRIAIAGFQHETNTFVPMMTGKAAFRKPDSWPGLLLGTEVIDRSRAMNIPVAGAVLAAEAAGVEVVPILWCAAEPGGKVTDEAFDWISGMILEGISNAEPLDAVYLDLHGAMVTQSFNDGEAELLARIRKSFGSQLPIGVSLDLHANISRDLVDRADIVTIYRTYPHLDMAETGGRCVNEILRMLDGCHRHVAFRQLPFLVPLHAQNTGTDPCKSLYASLDGLRVVPDEYAEFAMGFTAADIPDCGMSVIAYAYTKTRANELADALYDQICAREPEFDTKLHTPKEAVKQAMALQGMGPIILADVQDNAGAGGSADTTGILRALVNCDAPSAVLGTFCDVDVARQAHVAGVGAVFEADLGGKSGLAEDSPFHACLKVRALCDGVIRYTGEMYGGSTAEIGPSCVLSVESIKGNVWVVVSSERTQCLDRALFTHLGVDPSSFDIVCVKSTVHFRADFEPGSAAVLNVAAPGWFPCELQKIPYKGLRAGVRVAHLQS